MLAQSGIDVASFRSLIEQVVATLTQGHGVHGHGAFAFDDFLLPASDPYVERQRREAAAERERRRAARAPPAAATVAKWIAKHAQMKDTTRSHYTDELAEQFPEFDLLPDRIKDLLDKQNIRFPDDRRLVLEYSQSKVSVTRDEVSTLRPKGGIWLAFFGKDALRP